MHTSILRHGRWIALALVVMMLAACGGSPEPQASTEPVASAAAPSAAAASAEATAAASAAASVEASTAGTASSPGAALTEEEKAEQLQNGYGPLVLLSASVAAVDDTAQRAQSGEISDVEVMGRVIGLAAIVNAAGEALAGDAPIAPVEAVWADARAAATELADLVERWDDQQISSADVAGELEPLKPRVETILQTAEQSIGAEFDIPSGELEQIRTEAIDEMRQNLASPAAMPSVAPEASADAGASAAPEASADAQASAPAVAAGEGLSRAAPLAMGTPLTFENWAVTVTGVQRGDQARQAIVDANQFNTPPRDGFEYLLVTVELKNISSKPEAQDVAASVGLRATGDKNVSYPMIGAVPPQPLQGQLLPDGTTSGQQVIEVPVGEGNLMLAVSELTNFELPARYVAVDEGASVSPDAALDAVASTDLGANRDAPAKLGETVTTDDWEVTLLEVKRGDEAATLIRETNQFNEAAPEGSEYVLLRVRVRSLGAAQPDLAQSAGLGALKLTGANNVVYEAPAVVAPEPRLDALLFPGGEAEGWVALTAGAGEQALVAVWEPLFSFDSDATRYLALE